MTEARKPKAQTMKAPDAAATRGAPVDPMAQMREILRTQVVDLDGIFGELLGHAGKNLRTTPGYVEPYMRLALRTQSNCRASLEALARADRAERQQRGDGVA